MCGTPVEFFIIPISESYKRIIPMAKLPKVAKPCLWQMPLAHHFVTGLVRSMGFSERLRRSLTFVTKAKEGKENSIWSSTFMTRIISL